MTWPEAFTSVAAMAAFVAVVWLFFRWLSPGKW